MNVCPPLERQHGRYENLCLYFTSLQQRGHLETAPPFTVPCEGHEARTAACYMK